MQLILQLLEQLMLIKFLDLLLLYFLLLPTTIVVNSGGKRTYIQSAYALPNDEKAEIENKPFQLTGDSFPKIIVHHDIRKRWYDDNGILNIGIIDFLLDDNII